MKRLVFHGSLPFGPALYLSASPFPRSPPPGSSLLRGMINTATGELQVYCFPAAATYGSLSFSPSTSEHFIFFFDELAEQSFEGGFPAPGFRFSVLDFRTSRSSPFRAFLRSFPSELSFGARDSSRVTFSDSGFRKSTRLSRKGVRREARGTRVSEI